MHVLGGRMKRIYFSMVITKDECNGSSAGENSSLSCGSLRTLPEAQSTPLDLCPVSPLCNSASSCSVSVPQESSDDSVNMPCPPPPTKARLMGSYDAGWQQRGNQRSYSSMSGHGSLIGYHSKKVLAYDVLSVRCRKCEAGHPHEDHDCSRNHAGSAKSMEPQIAVNIITQNKQLTDANAVATTLIGDEDASTIHSVRRESSVPIEKWSDLNHIEKAFSGTLYDLKVQPEVRNYLRSTFGMIIHRNKNNPAQLKHDMLNATNHAFGDHAKCGAWCRFDPDRPEDYKHDGLPGGKDLTDLDLKAALIRLFARYAKNAGKIAPCGSSQLNENFNKIVFSKHPKDRHYAGSESLRVRFDAPIILRHIQHAGLLSEFLGVAKGFVDTLDVMKASLPEHKESFKQTSLAALYEIETENAHDALGDVQMLSKIIQSAGVTKVTMMRHAKTVGCIIQKENNLACKKVRQAELQVLKPLVSDGMISKIAEAGLSLEQLKGALQSGGEKGLTFLLGESVNVTNKPRVTRTKKTVAAIIAAVKAQQIGTEIYIM